MMCLLAWTPLLNPIDLHEPWTFLLLIPLALAIGIIYKALKLADLSRLPRESLRVTFYIVGSMILAAIALLVLTALV
ncbi:MAG: hypothetical protein WC058_05180 [Phycisphaeraceae bacterium]